MSGAGEKNPGGQPAEGTDEQGQTDEPEGLGFGPELPRRAVLASVQLPDVSETDFRESLDDPTIYEVSWVPGTGCSKKRASDSVLLLGSAQSTSDAQKNSLVEAQDSALKTSGWK